MAQIFLSHSKTDKDIVHFFLEVFAGTKVKPHLEELEKEPPMGVTANKIEQDIQGSNALFVLLSQHVEHLGHTRDWVVWECGTARNKDIWVFEPFETLGTVGVVVPRLNHYVLFERTEDWRRYLRSIIESYDDSHVLATLGIPTAGGALSNEKDRLGGAATGFGVGLALLLLGSVSKPSFGIPIRCWKCFSNYKVHRYGRFRCPVCNAASVLKDPQIAAEIGTAI